MAVPMLSSLRASLEGELWGIGKSKAVHLYNGLEIFDRFIPFDTKDFLPFLDMLTFLKAPHFQRAVVLPHSFRSALLFYGTHVKERVGYARNRRGFMLTSRVEEKTRPEPTVEHYLKIIDHLGGKRLTETPVLAITEDEDRHYYERFPDLQAPYAAFIAGAQYGSSKRWPARYFSSLADLIIEKYGMGVLLLPGGGEEALVEEIRNGARHRDRLEVKLMDIRDLKVCLGRASVVISNDTGPRHIASALKVPTIALLGPMDARYTQYPNPFLYEMMRDLPCRPCNKKQCQRGQECLTTITPGDVLGVMEEILGNRP